MERKIFVNNDFDIVLARMQARELAKEIGFSAADQARISLAASEMARVIAWNVQRHLSEMLLLAIARREARGVQVICTVNLTYVRLPGANGNHWTQETSPASRSLAGACQLVDESLVEEQDENSAKVTLTKWLK